MLGRTLHQHVISMACSHSGDLLAGEFYHSWHFPGLWDRRQLIKTHSVSILNTPSKISQLLTWMGPLTQTEVLTVFISGTIVIVPIVTVVIVPIVAVVAVATVVLIPIAMTPVLSIALIPTLALT